MKSGLRLGGTRKTHGLSADTKVSSCFVEGWPPQITQSDDLTGTEPHTLCSGQGTFKNCLDMPKNSVSESEENLPIVACVELTWLVECTLPLCPTCLLIHDQDDHNVLQTQ